MKPVMTKIFKKAGFYEDEIKPYTNTISAKGLATGAGLGGLVGFLIDKYALGDDSTLGAVLSSLGGALAGASLHTASQIMQERDRVRGNANLPPHLRRNPDGSLMYPEKPPRLDTFSGIVTGAGALVGARQGAKLFDRFAYNEKLKKLTEQRFGDTGYYKELKDLRDQYSQISKGGQMSAEARQRLQDLEALDAKNLATIQKLKTAKDLKALKFGGTKGGIGYKKFRVGIGNKGRAVAGTAGMLALASGAYALSNPRTREAIVRKFDGDDE